MRQKKVYRRDWLNKKKGRALIITTVDTSSAIKRDGETPWPTPLSGIDAYVELGDCSRSVNLDFCAYDKEGAVERLDKVRLIQTHLATLEASLVEAASQLPTRKQVDEWQKKDDKARKSRRNARRTARESLEVAGF